MLTGDDVGPVARAGGDMLESRSTFPAASGIKPEVEKLLQTDKGKKRVPLPLSGMASMMQICAFRVDVGIAMGALGSDAAIEAADVVLMDDDPLKIAKAIRIARKCHGLHMKISVLQSGLNCSGSFLVTIGCAGWEFLQMSKA